MGGTAYGVAKDTITVPSELQLAVFTWYCVLRDPHSLSGGIWMCTPGSFAENSRECNVCDKMQIIMKLRHGSQPRKQTSEKGI